MSAIFRLGLTVSMFTLRVLTCVSAAPCLCRRWLASLMGKAHIRKAPWQSIPRIAWYVGKASRLTTDLRDLRVECRASQVTAAVSSQLFAEVLERIAARAASDDATLYP